MPTTQAELAELAELDELDRIDERYRAERLQAEEEEARLAWKNQPPTAFEVHVNDDGTTDISFTGIAEDYIDLVACAKRFGEKLVADMSCNCSVLNCSTEDIAFCESLVATSKSRRKSLRFREPTPSE